MNTTIQNLLGTFYLTKRLSETEFPLIFRYKNPYPICTNGDCCWRYGFTSQVVLSALCVYLLSAPGSLAAQVTLGGGFGFIGAGK